MAIKSMVYASIFSALMCVGAYIHIPIGPVPIVLNNFFVLLAGLLLGPLWGFLSVLIYLLIGAVGFPVFAGGKSGLAHFAGPTGGYLVGFAIAAFVVGLISYSNYYMSRRLVKDVVAVVLGSIVIYALGLLWLKWVTKVSFAKAFSIGCLPFLPGDAVKAIAAVFVAKKIRNYIEGSSVKVIEA